MFFPNSEDFVCITDNAYPGSQIQEMETDFERADTRVGPAFASLLPKAGLRSQEVASAKGLREWTLISLLRLQPALPACLRRRWAKEKGTWSSSTTQDARRAKPCKSCSSWPRMQ